MVAKKRTEGRKKYENDFPTVTARVPAEVKQEYERRAAARGVSVATLVEEALIRGLAKTRDEWAAGYRVGKEKGLEQGREEGEIGGYELGQETFEDTVELYCDPHRQVHNFDLKVKENEPERDAVKALFDGYPCPRCERGEPATRQDKA